MMPKRLSILSLLALASAACAQSPATRSTPSAPATWATPHFSLTLNDKGLITSLSNPTDPHHMNWLRERTTLGLPVSRDHGKLTPWPAPELLSSSSNQNTLQFHHDSLTLTLHQSLADGHLRQSYTLTNTTSAPVTLAEGDFGIRLPFPDNYPNAATAVTNRCDVHLWTAGTSAWINAIRMGGQPPHLGLVLTKGLLSAYAIMDRPQNSNDRGVFVLCTPATTLAPHQSLSLEWTLFWNTGWNDFFTQALANSPQFIRMQADRYTLFPHDTLHLTASSSSPIANATLTLNGHPLPPPHITGTRLEADITPAAPGDQVIQLTTDKRSTFLRAFLSERPLDLIKARVQFILDHQQQHAPGDPTDNAFLAYDNQTHQIVLDKHNDHNAGRERVGMGVLLALYYPRCNDPALKARILHALAGYESFVTHHLQDPQGHVFNNTDDPKQRLYNYPWVAHLHLAMFHDTQDPKYLDAFVRTIRAFYAKGGEKFYPIGLPIRDGLATLANHHRSAEHDELLSLFKKHADRILAAGLNLPRSEVNYEQSIVAPACQILYEVAQVTGDNRYRDGAAPLLDALLAFNGRQPDFHLHDLAIRHWDDYWFGKSHLYGDTFPHYWSTVTAVVLDDLARIEPANAPNLHTRALKIIDNNLSLFRPDGSASCAYVYPLSIDNHPGRFYDAWANDQDWALVNYLTVTSDAKSN